MLCRVIKMRENKNADRHKLQVSIDLTFIIQIPCVKQHSNLHINKTNERILVNIDLLD